MNDEADIRGRSMIAAAIYGEGKRRVREIPAPEGQKFPVGALVRIADDLGPAMAHFPMGKTATVLYTYAHAYGGDDVKSYCLEVEGVSHAWYNEHQLTLAGEEWPEII